MADYTSFVLVVATLFEARRIGHITPAVRGGHTPPERTMDMGNKRKSAAGGRTSRPHGSAVLGPVTGRGFELIEFADRYGEPCSLQQSSLAEYVKPGTSAVWLGCERARCTPQGEPLSPRMHLDRKQVAALIAHLQRWLDADTFRMPNAEISGGPYAESDCWACRGGGWVYGPTKEVLQCPRCNGTGKTPNAPGMRPGA